MYAHSHSHSRLNNTRTATALSSPSPLNRLTATHLGYGNWRDSLRSNVMVSLYFNAIQYVARAGELGA